MENNEVLKYRISGLKLFIGNPVITCNRSKDIEINVKIKLSVF